LFRYATQIFKQTKKKQVKSGDLTLRKIDDCLFAIYSAGVNAELRRNKQKALAFVPVRAHYFCIISSN
jgi:hypothetical protein